MTRSPRVDSACRFFPEIVAASPRAARLAQAAITIGLGLALSCGGALAQNAAKGSPDHIKAVTSAVDGASIKANTATSNDWPTIGLDYAETRFSKLNQINTDNVKKLGLVWSYPLESSRGVEATPARGRRHHVSDRVMERGARHRRPHRQAALELRSRSVDQREGLQGLLRRRQSRRRALEGQGVRRRL